MEVLGVLLPLAIGVAFSSVPITAMLMLLLSRRGTAAGIGYFVGYAVGLAGVTIGFALGLGAIVDDVVVLEGWPVALAEILLGVAMVTVAIVSFTQTTARRRRSGAEQSEAPSWMRRLGGVGPVVAVAVGLVLNLRPKALLLAAAAALALNTVPFFPFLAALDVSIAFGIYLALGLSTVAVPLVMVLRSGERARSALENVRGWLERNAYIVTALVVVMVGVVLLGDGLSWF